MCLVATSVKYNSRIVSIPCHSGGRARKALTLIVTVLAWQNSRVNAAEHQGQISCQKIR